MLSASPREGDGERAVFVADLVKPHPGDPGQGLRVEEQQQCRGPFIGCEVVVGDEEAGDVSEALLLGDDRLSPRHAVGEDDGREVPMRARPAHEPAAQAPCRGAGCEPVVDASLRAGRRREPAGADVLDELQGDGGGLLRGEEGALLQRAGVGEVLHPVQVNPAGILPDQPRVGGVRGVEFAVEPGLESFDVEGDRVKEPVLDAELTEERDLAGMGVLGESGVLERDGAAGKVL